MICTKMDKSKIVPKYVLFVNTHKTFRGSTMDRFCIRPSHIVKKKKNTLSQPTLDKIDYLLKQFFTFSEIIFRLFPKTI